MKAVVLLCLFGLIALASAQAQTCNFPLFVNSRAGWATRLNFWLTTPAVYTDSTFCPSLSGKAQCCNANTYEKLDNAWSEARAAIEITVDNLRNLSSNLDQFRQQWNDAIDRLENDGNIPESTKQAIRDAGNKIFDAVDTFLGTAIDNWAQCATGYLKYVAGLVCLACDANWNQYITTSPDGLLITVAIATSTCSSIQNDCLPFWDDLRTFITSVGNAIQDLLTALGAGTSAGAGDVGLVDICNGDCRNFICALMILGADIDYSDFGNQQRRTETIASTHAVMREKMGQHSEIFIKLTETLREFNMANNFKRQSASTATSYSNSGYKAYDEGNNSGFDTAVNSASGLFNWMNIF